jgi:hypothetical protein
VIKTYSLGRFEIFVVVAAISIVAVVAIARYVSLAKDARNLQFELIAHHFMTGAANTRTQWLLKQITHKGIAEEQAMNLVIGEHLVYFSAQGWPLGVIAAENENEPPLLENCYQLWMLLLQNPAPLAKNESGAAGGAEYQVAQAGRACRYSMRETEAGEYYFDYFPAEGRMLLTLPAQTQNE